MTEKSPSLGVVSDSGDGLGPEEQGSEKRRVTRLSLTTEQFRLSRNGKIFSVVDLSTDGMALRVLDREDLVLFPVSSQIDGFLNLRGQKYSVQARVRHLGSELVGCQFDRLEGDVIQALTRFLDPVALGSELKPIPSTENGTLWYHGPSGTDLLFWRGTDGQYKRFALFMLGSFVQWDSESRLRTGRVRSSFEQSEIRGVFRFETLLLDPDSRPDQGKLSVAKTLILSSNLTQDLKKWCLRLLGS